MAPHRFCALVKIAYDVQGMILPQSYEQAEEDDCIIVRNETAGAATYVKITPPSWHRAVVGYFRPGKAKACSSGPEPVNRLLNLLEGIC